MALELAIAYQSHMGPQSRNSSDVASTAVRRKRDLGMQRLTGTSVSASQPLTTKEVMLVGRDNRPGSSLLLWNDRHALTTITLINGTMFRLCYPVLPHLNLQQVPNLREQ